MVLLAPIISIFTAYLVDKKFSLQRELAAMLDLSQRLTKTLDLGTLMQISIDESVKVTGLGTGAIYLIEGSDALKLWATTPHLPPDFPEELRNLHMADHPHIQKAISTTSNVVMADTAKTTLTPAEQEVTKLRNLRTILYVPLLADDEVLGVFIVGSIGAPCVISKDQERLCETIANQTALAVKNSMLYEEKLKKIAELERWQKLTAGREVRMGDLKNEIEELKEKLKKYEPS
jgi:GAF domain-containing protein